MTNAFLKDLVVSAVETQFGAALSMLEGQIREFPDDAWEGSGRPEPWQIAYHTLFYVDLYCSPGLHAFEAPKMTMPDANDLGIDPRLSGGEALGKAELLVYCTEARQRVHTALQGDEAWLASKSAFPWLPLTNLELLLYTLRHTQHHTRELGVLAKAANGSASPWLGREVLLPSDKGMEQA
jgi:hypothetical protein